jgi:hypothetical protein
MTYMRCRRLLALSATAWLLSIPALAGDVFGRILLPLTTFSNVPGAYGSSWTSTFTGRTEQIPIQITQTPVGSGCVGICQTSAFTTFKMVVAPGDVNRGAFVYVSPADAIKTVTFALRIQDVSRQASTWGTSVPVVREEDVRTSTIELLDLPRSDRFRVALRIYDFDSDADRAVRLRVFYPVAQFDQNPVVDVVLPLNRITSPQPTEFPAVPSVIFIGDLYSQFPEIMNAAPPQPEVDRRIRVQLDPAAPNLRFWAFASVTNNETQHVTVIPPK